MYSKKFEQESLDDIKYPVNPVDITQLEKRLNISSNLFIFFDNLEQAQHQMYISLHKSVCKIDLLYINAH